MPTTLPQNNLNTTSDGTGRNIRPELMPESFFFLEKDKTFTQTLANKFGVIGNGINSTFRTTSKISYTGKVFTICQGQIFIQPNSGDINKVNIVLKPFSQPIKGLAIKYIVYRGLAKSDFFTDDGKVLPSGSNATGFINYVQEEFQNFYGNSGANTTPPEFLAEFLGYPNASAPTDQQQKETDLIDDYFFKVSQNTLQNNQVSEPAKWAYEMPLVPRGTHLGNALGELGIDIVLNEGDYTIENDPNPFQLNLKFARSADYVLTPADGSSDFEKKLIKESVTSFIDVAAFYGLHTQGSGKVFVNTQTNPLEGKDDIYNLIKNFNTSNTTYLYIQSNRQRSYNFYGNYDLNGKNMKIGIDVNNLQEKKFGTEGWPIEEISYLGNQGRLYLQLLYSKDINTPILYSHNHNIKNTKSIYFAIQDELIDASSINKIDYTKKIEFSYDIISNKMLSSLIFINFEGVNFFMDNLQNYPLQKKIDYLLLHNIFPILNEKSSFMGNENEILIIENMSLTPVNILNYKQGFLASEKLVLDFGREYISNTDFISKKRVIFISHITNIPDNIDKKNSRFLNVDNLYEKDLNSKIIEFVYGEKGYSLQYYILKENNEIFRTLGIKYNEKTFNEYFHVGIIQEELENLKQIIPTKSSNVRLKFKDNTNYDIDKENNVVFYKFSLGIIYENSKGDLEERFPKEEIFIYGIKINYLTSKSFAILEYKAQAEQIII